MLQILWKLYSNSLNIHLAINSLWRSWLHFDRTPPTCPAGAGDWRLAYVKKYFLRAHRCPGWVFGSKLLICVGTNGILPLLNRTAGEQLRRHLYHSSMWFYQQYICIYINIWSMNVHDHLIISSSPWVEKFAKSAQAGETSLGTSGRPPEMIPVGTFRLPPLRTLDTWQGHEEMTRKATGSVSIMIWRSRKESKNLWWICRFLLAGKTLQSLPGVNILPTLPYLCPEMNHSANSKLTMTSCEVLVYAAMRLLLALWRFYISDKRRPWGTAVEVRKNMKSEFFVAQNCCSIALLANCFGGHQ